MLKIPEIENQTRIWIYQSSKDLNENDCKLINIRLSSFVNDWKSHENSLSSSFKILKNRFICIEVNEAFSKASGCSIDKSVNFMKELGKEMSVDFLNRDLIYENDGVLNSVKVSEIKSLVLNQRISKNTYIYILNISNKIEFENCFRIKAENSWVKRYFQ